MDDEGFFGILRMECNADGCECHVTGVVDSASVATAWQIMRAAARGGGWVCTDRAHEEGPHYCGCDHREEGSRDPR
jgi:hypothetical protein